MSVEQVIKERRTIHNYTSEKVSNELVSKAIELALFAPNHKHTQPWRFFNLGREARELVAERGSQLKAMAKGERENSEFRNQMRKKMLDPSHLIVVAQKKVEDDFQTKEDFAAIACGVQNIQLFLWSHNIGAKWSTGEITRDPLIFDLIKCNAKDISLEGFLWIGVPEKVGPVPPKANLAEVLTILD